MDSNIKYNNFENEVANVTVETMSSNNNDKIANGEAGRPTPSTLSQKLCGIGQRRLFVLPMVILAFAMLTLTASLVLILSVSSDAAATKETTISELFQMRQELKNTTSLILARLRKKNKVSLCAHGYKCVDSRHSAHEQMRCFKLNTAAKPWHQARQHCRGIGGFLAEVQDYATLDFVKGYLKNSRTPSPDVWLGGTDNTTENLWLWDTTRTSLTGVWNWEGNACVMPSYQILRKDCLRISATTGKWCHEDCAASRPFLCQKEGDECDSSGWHWK